VVLLACSSPDTVELVVSFKSVAFVWLANVSADVDEFVELFEPTSASPDVDELVDVVVLADPVALAAEVELAFVSPEDDELFVVELVLFEVLFELTVLLEPVELVGVV